jgi:hypothetical protein
MALDKTALAAGIKSLQDNLYSDTSRTPDEARTHYANELATLIDTFVKTGSLSVPGTGLTAGVTAVTGTSVTGTIS